LTGRIDEAARVIDAAPATIYRAFTSAAALETWLPPTGGTGRVADFAFREGGGYRMRLAYDAPGHPRGKTTEDADEVTVRFVRLVAARRIEQVVDFASQDPAFAGSMTMIWTFTEAAMGTTVAVRCENVPAGIRAEDHQVGLNASLENLAAFTE
jgi:uncharacterized protein YndB with AHSA1/START domain